MVGGRSTDRKRRRFAVRVALKPEVALRARLAAASDPGSRDLPLLRFLCLGFGATNRPTGLLPGEPTPKRQLAPSAPPTPELPGETRRPLCRWGLAADPTADPTARGPALGTKAPDHLKPTRRPRRPGRKRPAGRKLPLANNPPSRTGACPALRRGESISTNLADGGLTLSSS